MARHGTVAGYVNDECRCDDCKAAMREYRRQHRAQGLAPNSRHHGTMHGYSCGCRCDDCRAARSAAHASRSAAKRGLDDDDPRHGTATAYTHWSCRCSRCREAQMARQRARRRRKEAEDG